MGVLDETINSCIQKALKETISTEFTILQDMKLLQLFKDQSIQDLDDRKDQYFCWLSINVSGSVSAKQQIPCSVSFLPWWEDWFFHQGQRQVTNWAVAAAPIPVRRLHRSPPLHSSQPPTYTQNLRTYTPVHLHSHKQVHAKPPIEKQSLFPRQIHKVYLTRASTQKRTFPRCAPAARKHCNKQPWIQVSPSQGGFHTIINMCCTSYCKNP